MMVCVTVWRYRVDFRTASVSLHSRSRLCCHPTTTNPFTIIPLDTHKLISKKQSLYPYLIKQPKFNTRVAVSISFKLNINETTQGNFFHSVLEHYSIFPLTRTIPTTFSLLECSDSRMKGMFPVSGKKGSVQVLRPWRAPGQQQM